MSGEAMTPVRLTVEQQRALEVRGSSVALGAGAGCGKTTVLTERFLGEIEGDGGRALRALVALTFTEKASRELRQRIRQRCREQLALGVAADRWRTVLRALEAAPIGTFHEFCAGILRAHAVELGLDPEFAILDESVAASLRDQAVRSTVRRMLAGRDPDLISLGLDYGLRQVREALTTLIGNRTAADLDAWSELSAAELVDRWKQAWQAQGRPAVFLALSPLARRCRELLTELDAAHPTLRQRREALLELLPDLEACACGDDLLAELLTLAKVGDLGAKGVWPSAEVKETFRCLFERLRKKIDEVSKRSRISESLTLQSAENSLRLARLATRARREYQAIKAARRGLDFDDLLVKTRDLLGRKLGRLGPIDFLLVDEFQDTDRVQSEILRLLGGGALFLDRMFVVGDAKQSIYRFRGAEPAILGRWRAEFAREGRLWLTENFRSVPGVIHFVNALFADVLAEADPDGDAADGRGRALVPVRRDISDGPAVTFLWAQPPALEDGEPEAEVKASAEVRRTSEARCLARLLRERLTAGWTIVDRRTKETRPAHAGDVTFLFRAMTEVWPYEAALAEAGFDYHTLGGSAFYAQQEVRDVVNVLSVVEDPLDEVALAGALRSPFFGLSDDGLFWLAKRFNGGLVEGVERSAEIVELNERDRRAAARARELLAHWRSRKDRVPLAVLVAMVLDESGFEAALVCEFLGSRKLANTRKLVRLAGNFDRQEYFTLGDFVARLRADLDHPPREEQAATTEEDSPTIRLMSVHQAKGLEFPIVVLPDLNRKANPRTPLVGMSAELGLVVRPPKVVPPTAVGPGVGPDEPEPGESLGWLAFQAIEDDGDRRESLRLFYVATTRARDHLVLSAGLEAAEPEGGPKTASPAFELLVERFDWRTGRCRGGLPDGWPEPRVEVVRAVPGEPEGRRPGSHPARRLPEIERVITMAEVLAPGPEPRPTPLPGLVELDPARGLTGLAARRDRLIRAVLADRGLFAGEPLGEACARVGARQVPAANSALVAEAVAWLGPWPATPLFRELREAARARSRMETALGWMLAWPFDEEARTVVRGSCEAAYRDRQGRWRPVIVSTNPGDGLSERLRLMFSGVAAARRGRGECGPGWWVRKGPDGTLAIDVDVNFHLATIGQVLDEWWRTNHRRA